MVYNPKEIIYHYLDHNRTGTWDKEKCKNVLDSTVRDIIKSILVAETLNHWVCDIYVDTVSMTSILPKLSVSSSYVSYEPNENTIINKENYWDDDPYDMFDDTFEDLINSNAFTVKGYIVDKYVM